MSQMTATQLRYVKPQRLDVIAIHLFTLSKEKTEALDGSLMPSGLF
jgi:hypothetical protein